MLGVWNTPNTIITLFFQIGNRCIIGLFDNLLNIATFGLVTTPEQRQQQRANNAASDIAGQQQQQFGNIYGQGQGVFNAGQGQLGALGVNPLLQLFQTGQSNNPLLQQFGQAAGLNFAPPPGQAIANPVSPGGGFTNGVPNTVRGQSGLPLPGATSPVQGANAPQAVNPQHQQLFDAYGLTQPQQVQLNQQINRITQSAQSHISQYQQRMSSAGVSPQLAAEGAARLQAEYDSMSQGLIANFAESARAQKEQALQALISAGEGAYAEQQGFGQQQQQLGLNTSLNATTGLTNPQAAQNQLAQQAAAQQSANNASLLNLATQFLPGGAFAGGGLFGSGGTPPIAPIVGGSTGLGASGQGF